MADRNWNQRHASDREDWDREGERYNQQRDYDQGRLYDQMGSNRNYNEESGRRGGWGSNYENMGGGYQQGSSDPYQSRNRGYGQQGQYGSSQYGNRQSNEDWYRRQGQGGSAGMYGGDFGPEEWERTSRGYGGNRYGSEGYGGYQQGSSGYGSGQREPRNRYGGDTSNYGNANQGGFDRSWWDRARDKVSSWFDDDDDRERNRDRRFTGGHRGKGPKDYQRSTERIREDICDRLSDDDNLDATHINVQVQGNEVVLTGTVSDRYQKRYAEDLVESVSGVRHVENRLRVGETADMQTRNYTNNSDNFGGVGDESGTTNEIIRNANKNKDV